LRCARNGVRQRGKAWKNLADRLARVRPGLFLKQRREVLELARERLDELARHRMREWQNRLETLEARLRLLGPEQVLARGYSITMDAKTGKVLRSAKSVKPGQQLKTRLKEGEVRSTAEGE
jgi:exodeoxyribonuclease VII large subunit